MGYFETYCNSNKAKIINEKLIQMYTAWHSNWVDKEKDINTEYYHPTLLTCTDAYLDRRIMMFGREAHVKQKVLCG